MHTAHPAPTPRPRHRMSGFTLIEILIAVAILAILAGVALPTFLDSIRKSRRSEAFQALNAVQQAQERHRSNNASYTANLTAAPTADPPGLGLSATTPGGGYYGITLLGAGASTYTAVATATASKSQVNDGACAKLAVRMAGGDLQYASATAGTDNGALAFAASNACWNR